MWYFPLIIGLPGWLTFNLIHSSASAEPLIKAGRQLGECQGGLGPTEATRDWSWVVKGEGQRPGCNPDLPLGLSMLSGQMPACW
jgi:hypothetical protein